MNRINRAWPACNDPVLAKFAITAGIMVVRTLLDYLSLIRFLINAVLGKKSIRTIVLKTDGLTNVEIQPYGIRKKQTLYNDFMKMTKTLWSLRENFATRVVNSTFGKYLTYQSKKFMWRKHRTTPECEVHTLMKKCECFIKIPIRTSIFTGHRCTFFQHRTHGGNSVLLFRLSYTGNC